jgi:hypothetical protein
MIRSTGTLALLVTLLLSGRIQAEENRVPDPHVRATCAQMLRAVTSGAEASSTLRGLVDRLQASDVVVYLMARRSRSSAIAAHVAFISAAGGRRYLLVAIDPKYSGAQLIGLIGHELRHAVEIAEEPSVVDERSLAALYRRIGFADDAGGIEQYETGNAIETGGRIMRDVIAHAAARASQSRLSPLSPMSASVTTAHEQRSRR